MPAPFVPFFDLGLLQSILLDSFGIAVISYVISLSISRIVAAKFKYQVTPEVAAEPLKRPFLNPSTQNASPRQGSRDEGSEASSLKIKFWNCNDRS